MEIIKFVKPNGLLTSNFDVKITNSTGLFCGKFYPCGGIAKIKSAMGTNGRPLIITRVTKNENRYPHFIRYSRKRVVTLTRKEYCERKGEWKGWRQSKPIAKCTVEKIGDSCSDWKITIYKKSSTGGYIDHLILSREEALVHVLAHEFRHLWQVNHPKKRGKVWGARGLYSDRDADYYAIHKTRAWRRLHSQPKEVNWNLVEGATSTNVESIHSARREQLD
jgi:hypothetical protein